MSDASEDWIVRSIQNDNRWLTHRPFSTEGVWPTVLRSSNLALRMACTC